MKSNLIIIGLVLFANIAYSQEQPTATLKIGTIYDPLSGIVLVPVTCEAIENPLSGINWITSWEWYIAYDTNVLNAGPTVTLLNLHPGLDSSCIWTNIFPDNPGPGWNTIVVIGCPVEINPGEKFFDIQFTYVEGLTAEPNIIWTSLNNVATNMSNDVGDNYFLTLIDGYVGPYITKVPELKTEPVNFWFENGDISFNCEAGGEFSLFNLFGQQVMSASIHAGLNQIPVKDENAFYLIRIVTNNKTLTQKIFIQ